MIEYAELKLELREWTSKKKGTTGSTYCFNNQAQRKIDFCGLNISLSVLDDDVKQDNIPPIYGWGNEMNDQQYQAFVEEYGDIVYYHLSTKQMFTKSDYDTLMSDVQNTEQVSEQVSSDF